MGVPTIFWGCCEEKSRYAGPEFSHLILITLQSAVILPFSIPSLGEGITLEKVHFGSFN